jgi:hypothetical protein
MNCFHFRVDGSAVLAAHTHYPLYDFDLRATHAHTPLPLPISLASVFSVICVCTTSSSSSRHQCAYVFINVKHLAYVVWPGFD